jgi:ABC-type protease/lipase transport system fused ATPase/permease subunit
MTMAARAVELVPGYITDNISRFGSESPYWIHEALTQDRCKKFISREEDEETGSRM